MYIYNAPKCMSCHKAIVVITGRAHCFHDYMYIYIIYIYNEVRVFQLEMQFFYLLFKTDSIRDISHFKNF